MRPVIAAIAISAGVLLPAGEAQAQRRNAPLIDRPVPGYQQAERHNPRSPGYADFLPSSRPRRIGGGHGGHGHGGHHHHGDGGGGWDDGYYGGYGDPWYDYVSYGYGPGYGGYPDGYYGRYLPPVILSFDDLFRQPGWNDGGFAPAPRINIVAIDPPEENLAEAELARPQVRIANAQSEERGRKWLAIGDRYFGQQRYRLAYLRYKDAAESAPSLGEAYLRQAQAMVAAGQYESASAAFQRYLRLEDDLADVPFALGDLYAGQAAAQAAHVEALAVEAENDPGNADLLLLVGMQLHFDGQAERASPFLRQAAELFARRDAVVAAGIERLLAAGAAAEQAGVQF